MGCVSSKLFKKDLKQEFLFDNGGGDYINHVVSLTSTTYGALSLDNNNYHEKLQQPTREIVVETKISKRLSPPREEPEVINAWELMEGLEEEIPISIQAKIKSSPKPGGRVFLRGFADFDRKSPLKFLNQMASPRKAKKFGGKENRGRENAVNGNYSPKEILKPRNSSEILRKASPLRISPRTRTTTWVDAKIENDSSGVLPRRRSLSPLFDPMLVALYEKELSEEEEQIKMMVSPPEKSRKGKNLKDSVSSLESFEKKCPPGGEKGVVMYTTTLRGIRKTFEDCNKVRSIIESYCIQMFERDISMDSGFKEELRGLMGKKEAKVPLLFIKGRLIGGVDEVVKLEDEGKLGVLFDGIPEAIGGGCEGCAGFRFVMCLDCSGSCKVLDEDQKKTLRCGECNENGLIHCPICC